MTIPSELLEWMQNKPGFLGHVIISTEIWTLQYEQEMMRLNSERRTLLFPRPKKAKMRKWKVETVFIAFFSTKSVLHKEFVSQGQTLNSTYYVGVSHRFRKSFYLAAAPRHPLQRQSSTRLGVAGLDSVDHGEKLGTYTSILKFAFEEF
ncbi:hypothetical protein Trydic_g45 [Trypoxylus dichotomus]